MFNTNNEIVRQLDNLTIRFNQTLDLFNMVLEKKSKELSFLNNKRNFQRNENNNYNIFKGNILDFKNNVRINYNNSYKIDNCVNINLVKSNKITKQSNDSINKNKNENIEEININGNNCQNEPIKKII